MKAEIVSYLQCLCEVFSKENSPKIANIGFYTFQLTCSNRDREPSDCFF